MTLSVTAEDLVKASTKARVAKVTLSNGDVVTITTYKWRHMPLIGSLILRIQRIIASRRKALAEEAERLRQLGDVQGLADFAKRSEDDADFILELVTDHFEELTKHLSEVTTLSAEQVQDLDIDDAVALVAGVVLLNKDFFMQKILPLLTGGIQAVTGTARASGT